LRRDALRRVLAVALLVTCAFTDAHAQLYGRNIELFGTVGGVAGLTPVSIASVSHVDLHGGFRLDAGIQGQRLGVGLGMRVWELNPTETYGGSGLDGFVVGEYRIGAGVSTTLRMMVGAGSDRIDGGHGPPVDGLGTSGFLWAVGMGHELHFSPSDAMLLTADVLMPNVNRDVSGRRAPVLEVGFGYRRRRVMRIGPLP